MIALGFGDQQVAVPGHICLFYDTGPELRRGLLDFVRPAIDDPRQAIVLFGPPGVASNMRDQLETDFGRSLERDVQSGHVLLAESDRDPDQHLENIRDAIAAFEANGDHVVRLIGQVAWGVPGFPPPEDFLWAESRLNDLVAETPALVVCSYDLSRLPGQALLYGGLETHPSVVLGGRLAASPSYLAPPEYMRARLLQLRAIESGL